MNIVIQCKQKCKGCFEHLLSPLNKQELIRNVSNLHGTVVTCPFAPATDDNRLSGVILRTEQGSLIIEKVSHLCQP